MSAPDNRTGPRRPDWLDDDGDDTPAWAELPRLEVGDQASASMLMRVPVAPMPSSPEPEPEPPELLPPPPGMVIVNDGFAALRRAASARLRSPTPDEARHVDPIPAREVASAQALVAPISERDRPQPVVYGIVVRNTTAVAMYDVRIEHDLLSGPRYVGAEPPPKTEGRKLIWDVGTLEPGSKQRFKITIQPNRADELPVDAKAQFRVRQSLHNTTRVLRPAVTLSARLPETAAAGRQVPLIIEAGNAGPGAADDVRILAPLPAGLTHADGQVVQFTEPRLGPNGRLRFEADLRIERGGQYEVPVHLVGNGKVLASAKATLWVAGADLHLRVEGPPSCATGRVFACQVDASNLGEVASDQVAVTLNLPDKIEATDAGGAIIDAAARRLNWPLGRLLPGESQRRGVRLSSAHPGEFTLRFEARDALGHEASATKSVTFDPAANPLAPSARDNTKSTAAETFVILAIGDSWYAVPAIRVEEVRRAAAPRPALPLIDLRRRLGFPGEGPAARVLVVRDTAGQAAAALLVDRLLAVRPLNPDASAARGDYVLGAADDGDRRVSVLNIDKLL